MLINGDIRKVGENLGCLQMPLFATKPACGRA